MRKCTTICRYAAYCIQRIDDDDDGDGGNEDMRERKLSSESTGSDIAMRIDEKNLRRKNYGTNPKDV